MNPSAVREKEAAIYIGVSEPTFKKLRKEHGDFPAPVVLGKRTRLYLLKDLDNWMESRRLTA